MFITNPVELSLYTYTTTGLVLQYDFYKDLDLNMYWYFLIIVLTGLAMLIWLLVALKHSLVQDVNDVGRVDKKRDVEKTTRA